ncbi:MAG: hypothetical protein RLY97_514, partial [Pseudomonadota bacterium]
MAVDPLPFIGAARKSLLMSDAAEMPDEAVPLRRKRGWLWAGAGAAAVLGAVWAVREPIADQIITSRLADLGLPVRYKIESIGPSEEVLRDVVVGDAAHPDLTIGRMVATTGMHGGVPSITGLRLEGVRITGNLRQGRLGFGALDRLIYGPATGKPSLPDLELTVVDGRGRIGGDFGAVGLGFSGSGNLRDGFSGAIAAVARRVVVKGCVGENAALHGVISVKDGRPQFAGPVRLGGAVCAQNGGRLVGVSGRVEGAAEAGLDGGRARMMLAAGAGMWRDWRAGASQARGDVVLSRGKLTGHYAARMLAVSGAGVAAQELGFDGVVTADGSASVQADGGFSGMDLSLDSGVVARMRAARDTPIGPLLDRMAGVVAREGAGSKLSGRYAMQSGKDGLHLQVNDAVLTGGSGAGLIKMPALMWDDGRISGRFVTGGGLPQIDGQIAARADGRLAGTLTMPEYRAGRAAVAVPVMRLRELRDGGLAMDGRVVFSGGIAGADVRNLLLPIAGDYAAQRGWRLGTNCVVPQFAQARMASLTLAKAAARICPAGSEAIVTYGRGGLRIAAEMPELALAGDVNGQPIALHVGPMRVGTQGVNARDLRMTLQDGTGVSQFQIGAVSGTFADGISGRFAGAEMALAAVPLDLHQGAGAWRYAGGALRISDAGFRLDDRILNKAGPDELAHGRFEPLAARDAKLELTGGVIKAEAVLREPKSMRQVVTVDLAHDMASG